MLKKSLICLTLFPSSPKMLQNMTNLFPRFNYRLLYTSCTRLSRSSFYNIHTCTQMGRRQSQKFQVSSYQLSKREKNVLDRGTSFILIVEQCVWIQFHWSYTISYKVVFINPRRIRFVIYPTAIQAYKISYLCTWRLRWIKVCLNLRL